MHSNGGGTTAAIEKIVRSLKTNKLVQLRRPIQILETPTFIFILAVQSASSSFFHIVVFLPSFSISRSTFVLIWAHFRFINNLDFFQD